MLKWQSTIGYFNPEKASAVENLIKNNVTLDTNCIEVGVFCGKSLMHLLEVGNPKHVYGIDPFEGGTSQTVSSIIDIDLNFDNHYKYDKVLRKFKDYDNVTLYKEYSPMTDKTFPDIGYAFIDGDHSSQSVLKDAEWIYSIMKKGVIVFDDYAMPEVKQAIDTFADKHRLIINLSNPTYPENKIAWIMIEKG